MKATVLARAVPRADSTLLQLCSPSTLLQGSCQADAGEQPLTSSSCGMVKFSLNFDQKLHPDSVYGSTERN